METVQIRCRTNTLVGRLKDNGVASFLGIPYAQPPVGELRWQPGQPLPESDALRECFDYGPAPIQGMRPGTSPENMSEDCLYLNIWTGDLHRPGKPVVLWIYGGGYMGGNSADPLSDGEAFVLENPDILLVSCNYRLGILATLNLSSIDPEGKYRYSNNLHILDTRAALRWLQENVAAFGGDPENITLFGQSAGSNNITANLRTAESRKYFRKAFCESSFALDMSVTPLAASELVGRTYLEALGCTTMEQALAIPAQRLLEVQREHYMALSLQLRNKMLSPVVDGIVLREDDLDRLDGPLNVVIGTNEGEYDQMFRDLPEEEAEALITAQARVVLGEDAPIAQYIANDPDRDRRTAFMDLRNDTYLRMAGTVFADACSRHGSTYQYYFTWNNPVQPGRTAHGQEISMLFAHETEEVPPKMAYGIRQALANLARHGDPNNDALPHWEPYTTDRRMTMVLDEQSYMSEGIRPADSDLLRPLIHRT